MASNGRMGLRSGSPSFLVIGLSLVIVVLLYSYWSVSSRNTMLLRDQTFLQDRLRLISKQKKSADDKYVSVRAKATELNLAKQQLEKNDRSSSLRITDLDSNVKRLTNQLQAEKEKFKSAQMEGEKSKHELEQLRVSIESTQHKFRQMKANAESMVDIHKKLKDKLTMQERELMHAKNEREMLKVKLDQLRESHQHTRQQSRSRPSQVENEHLGKTDEIPTTEGPTYQQTQRGHQQLVHGKSQDDTSTNSGNVTAAKTDSSVEPPTEQPEEESEEEAETQPNENEDDTEQTRNVERRFRNPSNREKMFKQKVVKRPMPVRLQEMNRN